MRPLITSKSVLLHAVSDGAASNQVCKGKSHYDNYTRVKPPP